MPHPTRRPGIRAAVVAASVACAIVLTGCTPAAHPAASASASLPGQAAGGATPTPTATAKPPTPVTMTCDQIVTPKQMYSFNPNFGADPGYTPKAGSLEKKIGDWKGATCAWKNQTSGDVIEIAVAQPPADQLESLKNSAIEVAKPVPTYGVPPQVEGYYKPGTPGQIQIFRGSHWVVAESKAFFEPGDSAPLMASVLANLPAN